MVWLVSGQAAADRRQLEAQLGMAPGVRDAAPDDHMMLISEFVLDQLRRLERELGGTEEGESIAAEAARFIFGEAMEANLLGPLLRIGLVERDIMEVAAAKQEADATPYLEQVRQPRH